jgi:hypothetical protein
MDYSTNYEPGEKLLAPKADLTRLEGCKKELPSFGARWLMAPSLIFLASPQLIIIMSWRSSHVSLFPLFIFYHTYIHTYSSS